MPSIRIVAAATVIVCMAPMVQAQARPIRQTAPVATRVIEGPDLVIEHMGLSRGHMEVSDPGHRLVDNQNVQTDFLEVGVTLTNQGNVRWSSSGTVEYSFTLRDIVGPSTPARAGRPSGGVSVVPRSSSGGSTRSAVASGTFRIAPSKILGSIGPGEQTYVQGRVLTGSGQTTVSLELGKSFTVTARIVAAGEPNNANNTGMRVGRLERKGSGYEMIWEPLTIRSAPTVMVNAPR